MRSLTALSLLLPLLMAIDVTAAAAQGSPISGLEVRGTVHVNRSEIAQVDNGREVVNSYGLGIEYVFRNLGLGLYGHGDGRNGPTISDTTTYYISTDANFFLPFGLGSGAALYVGAHANLGAFDRSWLSNPTTPDWPSSVRSLGYQIGFRFKPIPFAGVDAQFRHQSRDVWLAQEGILARDQFSLGVVLF
jgi:hypothetical protein